MAGILCRIVQVLYLLLNFLWALIFLAVSVCGFPKASTLSLILTRELIISLCLFAVSDCCEPPAAFFTSERHLTDLQNSVCGMFPKYKNLLHVTFKRQLHIIVLKYHCLHWSLWQRNSKHVSLLSLHHKNVYCPYFGLGIQTST